MTGLAVAVNKRLFFLRESMLFAHAHTLTFAHQTCIAVQSNLLSTLDIAESLHSASKTEHWYQHPWQLGSHL
jgi:hypothetical protein